MKDRICLVSEAIKRAEATWLCSTDGEILTLGPQNVNAPTAACMGVVAKVFSTKQGWRCRILTSFHSRLRAPSFFALLPAPIFSATGYMKFFKVGIPISAT